MYFPYLFPLLYLYNLVDIHIYTYVFADLAYILVLYLCFYDIMLRRSIVPIEYLLL